MHTRANSSELNSGKFMTRGDNVNVEADDNTLIIRQPQKNS